MENKICDYTFCRILSVKEKIDCIVFVYNIYKACQFFVANRVEIIKYFPFISAIAVRADKDTILLLSRNEHINYITTTVMATVENICFDEDINLYPKLKTAFDGEGVTVAVLDTGISQHLDFCLPKQRIKAFVDLIGGKELAYDDNGHGTLVASACLGSGIVSNGKYSGVAPRAEVAAVKCMSADGIGGTIGILEGMQWVIDNYKKYDISVVCMAFGATDLGAADPFKRGVKALYDVGITVVCAGGNSGNKPATIKSPASSPYVIAVGGAEKKDGEYNITDFSSRGPCGKLSKPDIVAPAVGIMGCNNNPQTIHYTTMTGTSIATGIVSGCVALLKQKYPKITPSQVKMLLKRTAIDYWNDVNVAGAGLINVDKFLI